jgi:hypothetical protein
LEFGSRLPEILPEIVRKGILPWFSSLQSYEQVRECTIRAVSSLFACFFKLDSTEIPQYLTNIFEDTLLKAGDQFLVSWLLAQFTTQTLSSFLLNRLSIERIHEWIDLCLNKNEEEEKRARVCLLHLVRSNWLWACCDRPLTLESAHSVACRIIEQLNPANRVWQTQTVMLLLVESFVCANIFFFTDADLEGIVRNIAVPSLMNTNYDIQDSAAELLAFLLKCSEHVRTLIPELGMEFKSLVFSGKNASMALKLSGVKGLGAIIHSTVLFDNVPDYVYDAFLSLSEAQGLDSALEQTIASAFTDFWAIHEENLMPDVAEMLIPFRDSVRPSYFC